MDKFMFFGNLKLAVSFISYLTFSISLFSQNNDANTIDTVIPQAGIAPSLSLSHFDIMNQFVDFKRLDDVEYRRKLSFGEKLLKSIGNVTPYSNYPSSMDLPFDINNLTIHFTAIDWKAPHKVSYSFYLDGYENGWSRPGTKSFVNYANLPSGKYTFKVRAAGESQIWGDTLTYSFRIRPAWWRSWWAKTLLGLCLAFAAFFILHILQQRKREVDEMKRLLDIHRELSFAAVPIVGDQAYADGFLNLVNKTLETHLSDENFGIAELCELLNISRAQLHRKLKKLTGLSTSHYIRSLRLGIAKEMLTETELNVSEVAFSVGFSSPAYFSKIFKSQFGYPPSESR